MVLHVHPAVKRPTVRSGRRRIDPSNSVAFANSTGWIVRKLDVEAAPAGANVRSVVLRTGPGSLSPNCRTLARIPVVTASNPESSRDPRANYSRPFLTSFPIVIITLDVRVVGN